MLHFSCVSVASTVGSIGEFMFASLKMKQI